MKKVLKFLDDNYPALILISLFSYYEYWLVHNIISLGIEMFKKSIEGPYMPFEETVSDRIKYCVLYSAMKTIHWHILSFFIIFLMRYMAKHLPTFNKRAFEIMLIATIVSIILFFSLELVCELKWHRVI